MLPEWSVGIGAIIVVVAAAQVIARFLMSKIPQPDPKPHGASPSERDQVLEDVQARLGELDQLTQRLSELEERVDFAERLLAKQREAKRLGPSQE